MSTAADGRSNRLSLHAVVRALALTFGLTTACLLVEISPLSSSYHMALYHFDGSASELFLPVLVNVAGLWALLTALILSAKNGLLRGNVWTGIMLTLPWVSVKEGTMAAGYIVPHKLSAPLMAIPFAGLIAVNIFWRRGGRAWVERLLPVSEVLLYSLSLTGVLVLGQFCFMFVRASGLNDAPKLHTPAAPVVRAAGEPRRVIVILFDELSYVQTYGHRSPRLALPAFDRLAAESMVFRDVRPAAESTDRAVPSLLTGRTVQSIRASDDGRQLDLGDAHGWSRLAPQDTVFGDALRQGYWTGAAGWYNPYCRILPEVLDRCVWHAHSSLPNMLSDAHAGAGSTLLDNSLEPLRGMLRAIPGFLKPSLRKSVPDDGLTERHVRDYRQISQAADALLSDSSITFVFLHLPIPHPGGIFDRHTGEMTQHTRSYLDNLALADRYLGHARQLLEQKGDWDDSAVVVLGDHSWRTEMWSASLFWTPEDQEVLGSQGFDDRPALVVKLPESSVAAYGVTAYIDTPFEARKTRWLLDELMTGKIKTEGQMAAWVEAEAR